MILSLICDEAPEEPTMTSTEETLKLQCDITTMTDCMATGIMDVGIYLADPLRMYLIYLPADTQS